MDKLIISSEKNKVYLQGNIYKILNKRHLHHISRVFNGEIESNKITIGNLQDDELIISKLSDFLKRKNISYDLDQESDDRLKDLYQEEKNFREFSMKAKSIWNNVINLNEFSDFQNVLHKNMERKLYPLQLLSAFHLAYSQNACNFSVPGAGKTSIVYGAFSYLNSLEKDHPKFVDKILVIGPLSAFGPWESEFEECFGTEIDAKRISGVNLNNQRKKTYFFSRNPSDLTLISYQGVINQKENIEYFLKNNNVMVVLDEAHKIKNTSGGQIAESILSIAPYCKGRVVLTGTPAPNGYRDLYNLFKFIWPKKDVIRFSPIQLDDMTKSITDARINVLIDNLSPYFVRIKKSDLGLPEKIEHPPIIVEMDERQKWIYETIEKKYIESFKNEESDYNDTFLSKVKKAKLIRLLQAATNPKLLNKPIIDEFGNDFSFRDIDIIDQKFIQEVLSYVEDKIVPAKFLKAYEIIKNIIDNKEKVIVWAVFINTILEFQEFLISKGVNCKILYGKTPIESEDMAEDIETRESIIRDFHDENSDFSVIIANPFAVAESISLHKACHNALYLERNFDAARFIQSKDRIHRYGLDPNIETNYFYLMANNSIDETINTKLIEKENLIIRVTESQDIPLFLNLEDDTENDIKALIKDYERRSKKPS
ncbi:Helicase conserved C-terminal domain-containing protein [Fictibacillus enclensis]|uniref:Helicase ATP-binding domain-containing protein n=1 Tax=Fictibacillus enclensis TaxID=1017270 RepID=A0A0V8JE39_9BACL|nr:DEAD/DEAH box helicase [Fictibacillus enclensis]KSU85169.1 hypothetical protein AS030_06530 [Fictibacillus enclensis]SCB92085.1 Helicase conserved C-terminal domain-containing protein [Fictibacillus enclensis]